MVSAEETKRRKAQQLRYKKPIVKKLNLETIYGRASSGGVDCVAKLRFKGGRRWEISS